MGKFDGKMDEVNRENGRDKVSNGVNRRCNGEVATADEILQRARGPLITGSLQMILEFIGSDIEEWPRGAVAIPGLTARNTGHTPG